MSNKLSKNKVKQIIYSSLQESANNGIQVHRIDSVNSIIEIDYEKITIGYDDNVTNQKPN